MSTPTTTEDPFRLGWRFVRAVDSDGQETTQKVPLTEHDLLFPQEEDFVVQRDPHIRDTLYLREALRVALRHRPTVHVFADHRIDFNLSGVAPLGPDVAVIDEIGEWDGTQGTLHLSERGRPLFVAEVTSPDTRRNDLNLKRGFYERAGVPLYVIIDRHAGESGNAVALLVLRLNDPGYHAVAPDEQGRVRLPQFGISLAIEDHAVWVYLRDGRRIEEAPELYDMIEEMERQVASARQALEQANEAASAQREQMETLMEQEIDLRQREAASRREAETRAEQAESRADQAEMRFQEEAAARRQLEQRLREMEEQLRQKGA